MPCHVEADLLQRLGAGQAVLHGDHRIAVAMGEEHRLRHRVGMALRRHRLATGQVGGQRDQAGQRRLPAQAGGQCDRPALGEAGQHDARSRCPTFDLAGDQRLDLLHRLLDPGRVGAVGEVHADDVVPGAHAHAAVDGHRPQRRVREHEAQRRPLRTHQLGHDRGEVVAVRAQAVQPQHRPCRRRAGFLFDALQQHAGLVPCAGWTAIMPATPQPEVAAGTGLRAIRPLPAPPPRPDPPPGARPSAPPGCGC